MAAVLLGVAAVVRRWRSSWSVLIGAEVAGVVGALVASPVGGTVQILLEHWRRGRSGPEEEPPEEPAGKPPPEDEPKRAPRRRGKLASSPIR